MSGRRNTSSPEAPHGFRRGLVLFPRHFGRVVAAGVALVVVALFGAPAASAYWPATGKGSTTAAVATLAPPTNVTVPASSNSNVAVTWTASAGTPVPTGYYVTRVTGTMSMAACGSSPSALITSTGCTDTSVPEGTHKYVVTAVHRSWTAASAASGNVTVSSTTDLRFSVQPVATVTAGSALPSVTVELRTIYGLPVWKANVPVTIAIGNNPGGGTLSGTLTATTNIWGEATFTGLSINKAGTGYTLVASSAGYSGAVSTPFNVTPAAATQLVVDRPRLGHRLRHRNRRSVHSPAPGCLRESRDHRNHRGYPGVELHRRQGLLPDIRRRNRHLGDHSRKRLVGVVLLRRHQSRLAPGSRWGAP